MPPTTTSTCCRSTSLVATVAATSSSVALSSMNSSMGRPSRPPAALMSSATILATLALATPMNDRAPVWSVIRPTRAGRSLTVLIVGSSRVVGADEGGRLRSAHVAGLVEDRRHGGVGDEAGPAGLVPLEQHPHLVRLV